VRNYNWRLGEFPQSPFAKEAWFHLAQTCYYDVISHAETPRRTASATPKKRWVGI